MREEEQIYCKMNDWQQRLLERVSEQTMTDYEPKGDFIAIENIWHMVDELSYGLEQVEQEKKELESRV